MNIAGGKGASLGEMSRLRFASREKRGYGGQANAKIQVPSGFVVLAGAFDRFLGEVDLTQEIKAQLHKINYDDINSVDRVSNVIRDLINGAAIPDDLSKEIMLAYKKFRQASFPSLPIRGSGGGLVAVRSSATAEDSDVVSWAGELDTFLNTREKALLENVKKCWSSLFTPRAIFYRREKDLLDTHVSVAVVVQEMVESEISGITFTVHPVTQDKNQMIIEAGWGLGEAIVSGSITPDSYVVNKLKVKKLKVESGFEILDINIAEQKRQIVRCLRKGVKWTAVPNSKQEKQKLTGKQIVELAKLCARIEKHYKKPQDIEWAFKDGKFYIVQSRPITTL